MKKIKLYLARIRQLTGHKPMKLQFKLFSAYVIFSSFILVSFATFFYFYVSSILLNKERDALATLNTSIENSVDAVIQNLDITSANINYSSLMSNNLDSSFNLKMSKDDLPHLADLFVTINGSDIKTDQINLFDLRGNEVKVGIITNTVQNDVRQKEWFSQVLSLNGVKLIGTPYYTNEYSVSSTSPDWFLSVYRTYSNQYGRKIGVIETAKRCKSVFKSVISYEKRNKENGADIYIFNSDGVLMYPYKQTSEEKESLAYYYQAIQNHKAGNVVYNPFSRMKEQLVYDTSSYSNWTYITVQQEKQILQPVNHLLTILTVTVLCMMVVLVFISYYLSRSMVKPVKHLKHIIQRMKLDTLGVENTSNYNPSYEELAELYCEFQKMSETLKISMDELIDTRQQELKSRTLALQSQINPHFYYNTLSAIIVLAENEKQEEVITLCRTLTQIMRYITDSSDSLVSLQSEIEYIQKYLYCMKVRYQSSLTCIIDIDPQLFHLEIPKLIIQPLVENAIKYGTNCIPPWTIKVIGRYDENHWQIDIIDSGDGFSEEAIEMIHQKIKEVNSNPGMPELKIDGLGLLNVYMRWKIHSKETTIFRFGNTPDGHAIVSIGQKMCLKEDL